jgi:hypothetical protein
MKIGSCAECIASASQDTHFLGWIIFKGADGFIECFGCWGVDGILSFEAIDSNYQNPRI